MIIFILWFLYVQCLADFLVRQKFKGYRCQLGKNLFKCQRYCTYKHLNLDSKIEYTKKKFDLKQYKILMFLCARITSPPPQIIFASNPSDLRKSRPRAAGWTYGSLITHDKLLILSEKKSYFIKYFLKYICSA